MKRANLIAVLVGLALVAVFTVDASAMYNPALGVFMQRDPGPDVPMRVGAGGPAPGGQFLPFDQTSQYADGMNLYQYVRSNPVNLVDWQGLDSGYAYEGTPLLSITAKRNHIKFLAVLGLKQADGYGHWWMEFDGESYGWWPKGPLGQTIGGLYRTLVGVEGELNGQTRFGGTPTTDPHHGTPGEEEFHPRWRLGFFGNSELEYGPDKGRKCKCASEAQIKVCFRAFANQYSGKWSYPFGQNCHSFQEKGMGSCCMKK